MHVILPDEIVKFHSVHLDRIRGQVPLNGRLRPEARTGVKYVFICFTNRSGSNYFAEALASDGTLNLGSEFLNYDEILRVVVRQNIASLQEYISGVALHDRRNGFFLSKLSVEHLSILHEGGFFADVIDNCSFIMVERADKLAQAVSYAIADQTQKWASYLPAAVSEQDIKFNASEVRRFLDLILEQTALFEEFFAINGIVPIKIIYEQFITHPRFFTAEVGRRLGLPNLTLVEAKINIQKQANEVNRAWRRQYLEDGRGLSAAPTAATPPSPQTVAEPRATPASPETGAEPQATPDSPEAGAEPQATPDGPETGAESQAQR